MPVKSKGEKYVFSDRIKCPSCKALIDVKVRKETITEPVKGEYKLVTFVGKSDQKTLESI